MTTFANIVTRNLGAGSPSMSPSGSPYPKTPIPVAEKKFVVFCSGRLVHFSIVDLRQTLALAGKLRRTFLLAEPVRALFTVRDLVSMTVDDRPAVDLEVGDAASRVYATRVYEELSDSVTYSICPASTAIFFHKQPESPIYTAFLENANLAAFKKIVGDFYGFADKDVVIQKVADRSFLDMILTEDSFQRAVAERVEFVVAPVEGTESIPGANMSARNIFDWVFACIAAKMRVVRCTSTQFMNTVQYDLHNGYPISTWQSYSKKEPCSDLVSWISSNPVYAARGPSFWMDALNWHRQASKSDAHVSNLEDIEECLKNHDPLTVFQRFVPKSFKLDILQRNLVKNAVAILRNFVNGGIHPEVAVLAMDVAAYPREYQRFWDGGDLATRIEQNSWEICDLYGELMDGELLIIRLSHGFEYEGDS